MANTNFGELWRLYNPQYGYGGTPAAAPAAASAAAPAAAAPNGGGLGAYQMPGMQNYMAAKPDDVRTFFNPFTSGHPMSEMTWLPPANPNDPRSTGTWRWNPREQLAQVMAPQQQYFGHGPNYGSQGGSSYGGYTTSGPQSGGFGYGGGQGGWGRGPGGGRTSSGGGLY
jgi:hypothetical protein